MHHVLYKKETKFGVKERDQQRGKTTSYHEHGVRRKIYRGPPESPETPK